jgi:hypothetical protein
MIAQSEINDHSPYVRKSDDPGTTPVSFDLKTEIGRECLMSRHPSRVL